MTNQISDCEGYTALAWVFLGETYATLSKAEQAFS
jgi:hypothetical protein